MGNAKWAERWDEYITDLTRLRLIPNQADADRVAAIITELKAIVIRNTEPEAA